jgi:class 3 adenylate cyclase
MALFNAPIPVEAHAIKTVKAIARIQQKMVELNQMWEQKNYPEFYIIAGINTSNCLVGNIGCTDRISYTALGDGVNVARYVFISITLKRSTIIKKCDQYSSRLKELNTKFKTRIIIGPETYEAVKENFLCRWLSKSRLRGRTQPSKSFHLYVIIAKVFCLTKFSSII